METKATTNTKPQHDAKLPVGSSVYLLSVPENQKKWFRKHYDTIKTEIEGTELMSYSMIENNIFGINERFINWNSDKNGLVDDYLENHILQEEKTGFIRDCLICVLEDCKDLEYFEMAHNVNLILMSFDSALSGYLKEIEDWYNKNGSNGEAF